MINEKNFFVDYLKMWDKFFVLDLIHEVVLFSLSKIKKKSNIQEFDFSNNFTYSLSIKRVSGAVGEIFFQVGFS